MEKSFPFNAVVTDGAADRVYSAEDFAAERAAYVSNGVTAEGALAVSPSSSGGLSADIAAGIAVIDGYTYFNTAVLTLPGETAHASLSRIDRVVLRLDLAAREMRCVRLTGTPASSPVPPACTWNETVREMTLAEIAVAAGAKALTPAVITDSRPRADYILNRLEVSELLAQYEAALREFFDAEDARALASAAKTVRTDAGADTVLCGDGTYRPASLDGFAYEELVRFTADGTFNPAEYPTRDGLYHVILQGGGGSGAYGTAANKSYGGEAGGFLSVSRLPLRSGVRYPVKVGAGGQGFAPETGISIVGKGYDGGATSFAGFSVSGGRGGIYGSDTSFETPAVSGSFTHEVGTTGSSGKGGDSLFAAGGRNNMSGAGGAGAMGSGGGAAYKSSNDGSYLSGKGGDGLVIIYGARPL